MLIKNAKVITMAARDYDCADILIQEGKIIQVAPNLDAVGEEIFEARGLTAIPGIVDAHSHIGMWEDGMDEPGADGNEATDPITPELRAIDAINPFDRCFEEARNAGVTTVVTGPGSANVICGQFAAIKTAGRCIDEMIVKAPCALKTALGENPKSVYAEQKKAPSTRMATAALFRTAFIEAQQYQKELKNDDPPERDLKKEILVEALEGRLPVKVHAHRADDIQTALRLAKEFKLKISIDHCTEGYLIPEYLRGSDARIILGPLLCDRCKVELKNLNIAAPAALYREGIEFALMTDHPVLPEQYLPVSAAICVRAGLPERAALAAITINAARASFIEERVGSLEAGKDADIVLIAGDPLDIRAEVKMVFIDGVRVK